MSRALTRRTRAVAKANGNSPATEPLRHVDWIIADISGSMGMHLPNTTLRRIDCLNHAINAMSDDIQILAFSDDVEYPPRTGPVAFATKSSTNLAKALQEALKYEPSYIVVISDGEPTDSESNSLRAAQELVEHGAVIDTLYIGPENAAAMRFMEQLAETGHGRAKRYDLSKTGELLSLTEKVQQLLPAPEGTVNL